jgi:ATP phosphoribosyltransferase regulatory subunit
MSRGMRDPTDAPPPLRMHVSSFALPAGMRDMLPARAATRRALARAVMGAFQRRGYDPVVPPAFEREEVIARGLGGRARSDLVRFLDPDTGEVMALRPDMTPQIARMVATRFRDAPPPVRLAYEGSVVRRPRGRSRRHRQVAQAGIECVGAAGTEADAEVIATACEALAAAGLVDGVYVEVAHAAITRAALDAVPRPLRDDVADALARRDRAAWGRVLGAHPEAARALDTLSSLAGDARVIDDARRALGPDAAAALDELAALRERLGAEGLGDRILVDLGELRGGGYYTGAHFQLLCEGAGDALASGGRYDELLGRYGRPMPATGCALDLEALEELLARRGVATADAATARVLVAGRNAARRSLAAILRRDGAQVAELTTDDADEARRYAAAHGYGRAVLCASDGMACELDATR